MDTKSDTFYDSCEKWRTRRAHISMVCSNILQISQDLGNDSNQWTLSWYWIMQWS